MGNLQDDLVTRRKNFKCPKISFHNNSEINVIKIIIQRVTHNH